MTAMTAKPQIRNTAFIAGHDDAYDVVNARDVLTTYGNMFGDHDLVTRIDPDSNRPFTRLTNEQIFQEMAARHLGTLVRDYAEDTGGWWFVLAPLELLETDQFEGTILTVIPTMADASPPYSAPSVVEMKEEHFRGHLTSWDKGWTVKGSSLQFPKGRAVLSIQVQEATNTCIRRAKERVETALRNAKNPRRAYNILTTKPSQTQDELMRRANRFYGAMSVNPTFLQEYLNYADDVMAAEDRRATEIIVPYAAQATNYFARLNAASYDRIFDESASSLNAADTRLQPAAFGRRLWRSENWQHINDGQARGDFLVHPSTTARVHLISPAYAAQYVDRAGFNAKLMQSIAVHDMRSDMPYNVYLLDAIKKSNRFDAATGQLSRLHTDYANTYNKNKNAFSNSKLPKPYVASTGETIHDTVMYVDAAGKVRVAETIGDLALAVYSTDLQIASAVGVHQSLKAKGLDASDAAVLTQVLGAASTATAASAGAGGSAASTAVSTAAAAGGNAAARAARAQAATTIGHPEVRAIFEHITNLPLTLASIEALVDPVRGNSISPLGIVHYDFTTLSMGDVVFAEAGCGHTFFNTANGRSSYEPIHDIMSGVVNFRLAAAFPEPDRFLVLRNAYHVGYVGGCTTNVVTSQKEYTEQLRNVTHIRDNKQKSGFFFMVGGNTTLESIRNNRVMLNGRYDKAMYYDYQPADAANEDDMLDCTRYYSMIYSFYTLNEGVVATAYSLAQANNTTVTQTCGFVSTHARPDISTGKYTDIVVGDGPLPSVFAPKMIHVFSGAKMVEERADHALAY
jgi:hypothetical protein